MTQTTQAPETTDTPAEAPVLKSALLARFAAETRYEDLPEDVVAKAERHILDTIGAGVAGAISKEAHLLRASLLEAGEAPSGRATLWGEGASMTPLNAALVNGTSAHAFELDDTGGCDHSGAVVLPAAAAAVELAAAEGRTVSGREFITAVVLGYDVARRALEACGAYEAHNGAGFHSTGTCGPFGAAVAAGRILGLNAQQLTMALGLASSYASGLWACVHDGAQSKRLHAGHAAWGGLSAAILARRGFTGPSQVFEDVWGGFEKSFAPSTRDPEAWTAKLGVNWKLRRVSIKPHASCRSTHSSIDALDNLMAEVGFTADEVAAIEVVINPFVFGMCGARDLHPMNSAQLSIPYALAADLVFGNAQLASYARTRRNDPRVAAAMAKVKMTVDDTQKDDDEPIVRVTLADGRTFEERVPMPLGSPVNPVSDEALLKKFRSVTEMVLPADTVEMLARRLMHLREVDDVARDVMTLLAQEPVTHATFDV